MKRLAKYLPYAAVSALLMLLTWALWWAHPEFLSYQEQYQLFLWDGDYLAERLRMVGGLADWLGEFVVQFYYVPTLGALLIAVVAMLLQVATAWTLPRNLTSWALGCVPVVLELYALCDENMLMSYPMALLLTMLAVALWPSPIKPVKDDDPDARAVWTIETLLWPLAKMATFVALYWFAGSAALLFLVLTGIRSRKWVTLAVELLVALGIIFFIGRIWFVQYPETEMYLGINYFRVPQIHPAIIYFVAASFVVVMVGADLLERYAPVTASKAAGWITAAVVALWGVLWTPTGLDDNKLEVLRYDYLVRTQQWPQIIEMADAKAPSNDFALQAVNLALAKQGMLADSMFRYPQSGINGLLGRYQLDNTSCLVTAEAFYHLGLVNSAFRYNFDLQEAIMNDRKSGRFMKRMADCMIINGKYDVARKYLGMLKKSLYYRDWAERAEAFLGDEQRIAMTPDWGQKRNVRFQREMLYDYPEIEKILAMLAVESEGRNPLAWDYFTAATMLKGDLPTLTGMYHYASELFGQQRIPRHVQEAIAMYWTFGHQTFDGLPYRVDPEVQSQLIQLAQQYAANQANPEGALEQHEGTFWTYYLRKQQQQGAADAQKGASRDD